MRGERRSGFDPDSTPPGGLREAHEALASERSVPLGELARLPSSVKEVL